MKKLRSLVLVSLPTMLFGTALVVACSEESIITGDGRDAQADTGRPQDSGGNQDAGLPPQDSGSTDSGPNDSGSQADVVTPQTVQEFATEVEKELCGSLTRCCFGSGTLAPDAGVDGGNYDRNACKALYRDIGFEFSSTGQDKVDAGEATVERATARDCLAEIQLLSCNLSGPDMTRIRQKCFNAIVGTRTSGQDCETAMECGKNLFCNPTTSKCEAVRGDGGACGVYVGGSDEIASVRSEEACSWRGSADNGLRCNSYDFVNGVYLPRAQWQCLPQVPVGEGCNSTAWCRDSICSVDDFTCTTPYAIFSAYCGRVTYTPDGG